jgi:hypothetical protein
MGQLRARIHHGTKATNGVTLGDPVVVRADGTPAAPGDDLADLFWVWDDPRLPTGLVDRAGVITVDEADPVTGKKPRITLTTAREPS